MVNSPSEVLTVFPRSLALIISRQSTTKFLFAVAIVFALLPGQATYGQTIVVFGDSISAAYGMDVEQGWVNLLAQRLSEPHPQYEVVNASVSGETTGGGVTRLPKTLAIHQPDVIILELGGNDGLRGYPIDKIRTNLASMIESANAAGSRVLLVGMVLPPNYGRRYTKAFEQVFYSLADEYRIPFVPFLLDGVTTERELIQRDGIHPTVEAQPKLLDDIWPVLTPMLD